MYTKEKSDRAALAIREIAKRNSVPEDRVREEMRKAIKISRGSSDPHVKAQWAEFKFSGEEPTEEEFITWMSQKVTMAWQEEGVNKHDS